MWTDPVQPFQTRLTPYSAEQMWLLADDLARSGAFRSWREVERELISRSYLRASSLLNTSTIRSRLDFLCAEARLSRH
jgi:hypothetical protein